jgi:hypothetical protein
MKQGFLADPSYEKGEVSTFGGSMQNRKEITLQGYLAHKKPPPPRALQYA